MHLYLILNYIIDNFKDIILQLLEIVYYKLEIYFNILT